MAHWCAVVSFLILQCTILGGIVVANPNLLPFISFSCRSVIFWVVVGFTIWIYLKAALTDPGYVTVCPSKYVEILASRGALSVYPNASLKVKPPTQSDSDDLEGNGDGSTLTGLEEKEATTTHLGEASTCNRTLGSPRASAKFSGAKEGLQHVVDFAQGSEESLLSSDETSGRWSSVSETLEEEYGCESSVDEPGLRHFLENEKTAVVQSNSKTDKVHQGAPPRDPNKQNTDHEILSQPAPAFAVKSMGLSEKTRDGKVAKTALLPPASLEEGHVSVSLPTIQPTAPSVPTIGLGKFDNPEEQDGQDDGLYAVPISDPFSVDSSLSMTGDLYPAVAQRSAFHRLRSAGTPTAPELQSYSSPMVLLKQSLGHVGVPIVTGAPASAHLGTVLTYAAGTAAAVPVVAVSLAAGQIAEKARRAFGQNNRISQACASLKQSTTQFHPRLRRGRAGSGVSHEGILDNPHHLEEENKAAVIPLKSENNQPPQKETRLHAWRATRSRRNSQADIELVPLVRSSRRREGEKSFKGLAAHRTKKQERPTRFRRLWIASAKLQSGRFMPSVVRTPPRSLSASSAHDPSHTLAERPFALQHPIVAAYQNILGRTVEGTPCQSGVMLRYCHICSRYQPLRAKHCTDCDACVRTLDHHCPWLGTCVGERNRFWFFWFLNAQAIELGWAMIEASRTADSFELPAPVFQTCNAFWAVNGPLIISDDLTFALGLSLYLVVCVVVMGFLFLMVVGLIGYHMFLASANMTTWENIAWRHITYLKDLPESQGSPFSKGALHNLYDYCCPTFLPAKLRHQFKPPTQVSVYGVEGEILWEYGDQNLDNECCCVRCCMSC